MSDTVAQSVGQSVGQSAVQPAETPVVVSASTTAVIWLGTTLFLALMLYYFIGLDQGATSVFGKQMWLHEFVHDGRHFLGFPCH